MILTKQVENEAIVSNVGATTDFKIKATAKSFRILADGLYSNKIRAIVRELSCNAYDSHVAAGKEKTPFDVHLPNSLEPWFSIRDYGVGLDNQEVTEIFTTFFESTKTGSNDFVGALGLGSKSPFSYTDNFTVTAIKNGKKGVYTAFINDHGVPSIAMMAEEDTTDPAGVEIKFAVENENDFYKFRTEAQSVYRPFGVKPVVSGVSNFVHHVYTFETENLVPGVHVFDAAYKSVAIMGNIEYPIQVPDNSDDSDLFALLSCGLVLEFNIGEVDFQASREGLSYIPQTVNAIKTKLEQARDVLYTRLAEDCSQIVNLWDKISFLKSKSEHVFWRAAARKCINDDPVLNALGLFNRNHTCVSSPEVMVPEETLKNQYNIAFKAFTYTTHYVNRLRRATSEFYDQSIHKYVRGMRLSLDCSSVQFVLSDTPKGGLARIRYHYDTSPKIANHSSVYILEAADKDKPMEVDAFFDSIYGPPEACIVKVSDMDEKPRKTASSSGGRASIMHLGYKTGHSRWSSTDLVWKNAGELNTFDKNKVYYYTELNGFASTGVFSDVKKLTKDIGKFVNHEVTVYGVRKADIKSVQSRKNWVNIDTFLKAEVKRKFNEYKNSLVKVSLSKNDDFRLSESIIAILASFGNDNAKKAYLVMSGATTRIDYQEYNTFVFFANAYGLSDLVEKIDNEAKQIYTYVTEICTKYPVLAYINSSAPDDVVREYIKTVNNATNKGK